LQKIQGAVGLQNEKGIAGVAGAAELQRVKGEQSCRRYSRDNRVAECSG
jgi:hypothetical protein